MMQVSVLFRRALLWLFVMPAWLQNLEEHKTVVNVSVVMECETDVQPMAKHFHWYKKGKEGVLSTVAYGQKYKVLNILEEDISQIYCEVRNDVGTFYSPRLEMHKECHGTLAATIGLIGGCIGTLAVVGVVTGLWMRKKKKTSIKHDDENIGSDGRDDSYTALDPKLRSSNDVYDNLGNDHSRPAGATSNV